MFVCELTNVEMLKNIIAATENLVDEGTFIFNDKGLSLRQMDPGAIALIEVNIPPVEFETYRFDEEGFFTVCLDYLKKVFTRISSKDSIQISLLNADKPNIDNKLIIKVFGKVEKIFSLDLLEENRYKSKSLQIPFTTEITFGADLLYESVKNIIPFSENASFITHKDKLVIKGEGNIASVESIIDFDGDYFVNIHSIEHGNKSNYALNYLCDIVKPKKYFNEVTLRYATKMPMELKYVSKDNSDGAYIKYFIAPRRET